MAVLTAAGVDAQLQGPADATRMFDRLAAVFQHPRCVNCHAVSAFPRRKDAGTRHAQFVVRGEDGFGAPALQCPACHQASNSADGRVPGAEGWSMPPVAMGWEGLTKAQVCEAVKDQKKNGGQKLEDLPEHIRTDPRVLWAWNPGAGRAIPIYSLEEFLRDIRARVAAGGPCPKDGAPKSPVR